MNAFFNLTPNYRSSDPRAELRYDILPIDGMMTITDTMLCAQLADLWTARAKLRQRWIDRNAPRCGCSVCVGAPELTF